MDAPQAQGSGFITCPRCAEHIRARASICRFCGHQLTSAQPGASRSAPASPGRPPKSAFLAAILAFFVPGLGHLYVGRILAGCVWFLLLVGLCLGATAALSDIGARPAGSATERDTINIIAGVLILLQVAQIVSAVAAARPLPTPPDVFCPRCNVKMLPYAIMCTSCHYYLYSPSSRRPKTPIHGS